MSIYNLTKLYNIKLACYNNGVVIVVFKLKEIKMKKLVVMSLLGIFVFGCGSSLAEQPIYLHY